MKGRNMVSRNANIIFRLCGRLLFFTLFVFLYLYGDEQTPPLLRIFHFLSILCLPSLSLSISNIYTIIHQF